MDQGSPGRGTDSVGGALWLRSEFQHGFQNRVAMEGVKRGSPRFSNTGGRGPWERADRSLRLRRLRSKILASGRVRNYGTPALGRIAYEGRPRTVS